MGPIDDRAHRATDSAEAPPKRPYVAPKLERLGTIAELTQGEGANNQFDGGHPPGQNKSII
jgi:hypothetical protein